MTAKEMLNKRKFNLDEPIVLSESDAEDLMSQYALHIAEQAVKQSNERIRELEGLLHEYLQMNDSIPEGYVIATKQEEDFYKKVQQALNQR